jgi:uncharacterized membrane protein YiaA
LTTFLNITVFTSCPSRYLGINLSDAFDAKAKTAQAFSMIAMVLGVVLLIVASLPCCCAFGKRGFMFVGFVCAFTAFSSLMTLIMRGSSVCNRDLGCEYGWTAWFAVAAGVAWLLVGVLMCALSGKEERSRPTAYVPPPAAEHPAQEVYPVATTGLEEVPVGAKVDTTEETIRNPNPDGSVTVIQRTTTHNPDGSKTVTETSHVENGT